jgi:hypothetical protein
MTEKCHQTALENDKLHQLTSRKKTAAMAHLTYEAFLDEVTTILTELYELDDAAAIKLVVDAQEDGFFSLHDDRPEMCTIEQAKKDAITLFEAKRNKLQTQKKQQQRNKKRDA